MSGADVAAHVLRAQRFNRAWVFRELFARGGYGYGAVEVEGEARRQKAWKSLRPRLSARLREEGKERIIERIRSVVRERRAVIPDWVWDWIGHDPWWDRPLIPDVNWDPYLEGLRRGFGAEYSPDWLEAVLRVLGDLTDEFLAELNRLGKWEIPAPNISVSVGAGLPPGSVVAEVGQTASVELVVPAGVTRTRQSRSLAGPVVVERVGIWVDAAPSVLGTRVQVVMTPAGASYGTGAAAGEVAGVALFEGTDDSGGAVRSVSGQAIRTYLEVWPRRAVVFSPARVAVTVVSAEAAQRVFLVAVDGRDVRLPS